MESCLISNLVECNKKQTSQPWPTCSFDEDFILVSEFSELVGPRPVLTVPEDGGASFNKNTFTVRIMSVDCTAPMSVDFHQDTVGSFRTVGDTQVVLVEPSEGAFAYVHHFTLYDINARGYVRPYCMAYVTNQYSKIMNNFAVFREHFSRISAYFKYGNALLFLQDLHNRLEYLNYTKRKLSENLTGKPIGMVYELPRDMKGFKFEDVEACERDTIELKKIILSYLNDDAFREQKEHFDESLCGLIKKASEPLDVVDALPSIETLDERFDAVEPRSLGISSGRKFDAQLRGLHELCFHSKEEAFGLMRNAYFLFGNMRLLAEMSSRNLGTGSDSDRVASSSTSQVNFKLSYSNIANLSKEFFLSATSRIHASHKVVGSPGSLPFGSGSSYGPSSIWTVSSCPSRSNSYEMIKTSQGSSDDEYVSVKDTDSNPSVPTSVVSIGSSGFIDYQPMVTTIAECFPGTAKRISAEAPSNKQSFSSIKGYSSAKSDETDYGIMASPSVTWEDDERLPENRPEVISLPLKTDRQKSIESNKSTSSSGSKSPKEKAKSVPTKSRTFSKVSIESSSSKDSVPSPSIFFHAPVAGSDTVHGISLMSLREYYKFLPHLIYSLMIGRPVIISADRSNKALVHSLVVSLLPCVPGYPRNRNSVIMWTKGPILVSNLATVKLVGLAKCRSRDHVPRSIVPYVSVLDFEKSTLTAPPYRGTYLLNCFDEQKEWPSDSVFRDYLHCAQLELSSQAFMMFSWSFSDTRLNHIRKQSEVDRKISPVMKVDAKSLMLSKFAPDDVNMIQYLVEILKSHLLGSYLKMVSGSHEVDNNSAFACIDYASRLSNSETPSVKLNILKCQIFANVSPSKRK